MKKLFLCLFVLALMASPAHAIVVTCTNCSNMFTQALERVTSMDQLSTMMKEYQEAVQQTQQQIRMVQQNIEQYANMLQNTAQLPANLVGELRGNLTRLANLSGSLNTMRGDVVALGSIFTNLFPEQGFLDGIAGAGPAEVDAANARYHQAWDTWAENVDRAAQATFQLSGQQLADLQKDPERFQSYLDELLSTPDGQQKAIMAGNQLAAVQVQEARQLRELMATQVQNNITSQMKEEKESQMQQGLWRDSLKTDGLGTLNSKPDPF